MKILNFLKSYNQAIDLDEERFNTYFPRGKRRGDFLLFNKQVVCEVKTIQDIEVKGKVEKAFKNGEQQGESNRFSLKRPSFKRVGRILNDANEQARDTKEALSLPDALGLLIIENTIPRDITILALIGEIEKKAKLTNNLAHIDCILLIDLENIFCDEDKNPHTIYQSVIKESEAEPKVIFFIDQLMEDMTKQAGIPLFKGYHLTGGHQEWIVSVDGKYVSHNAKAEFEVDSQPQTGHQTFATFLNFLARVLLVAALLSTVLDWLIK